MQFKALALITFLSAATAAPTISPRASASWSIRNFTRNCTNPNICTYKFEIDTNDGTTPASCTIVDTASPATTHAFYNVPCEQVAEYHISWGWDYQNDFTVMTTVNETSQLEAFFGYNHPNAGNPVSSYADVGPNAVQHT